MESLNAMKWSRYIYGALFVILGIYSLMNPGVTLLSLTIYIGASFLVSGAGCLYTYSKAKGTPLHTGWLIWEGILNLILGVLFLMNLGAGSIAVVMMLDIWVTAAGIFRIATSFQLRSAGIDKWWIVLLSGILLVVLAFVLAFHPMLAALTVTTLVAWTFIFFGVAAIVEGASLKQVS